MIDVQQKLEETKAAMLALAATGFPIPDEANELLEIMQRCVAAESALKTLGKPKETMGPNPIMKFFAYEHLPEKLQVVSKPIGDLAGQMDLLLPESAEKSAGLRKLLEAKDCLVRAAIQ